MNIWYLFATHLHNLESKTVNILPAQLDSVSYLGDWGLRKFYAYNSKRTGTLIACRTIKISDLSSLWMGISKILSQRKQELDRCRAINFLNLWVYSPFTFRLWKFCFLEFSCEMGPKHYQVILSTVWVSSTKVVSFIATRFLIHKIITK